MARPARAPFLALVVLALLGAAMAVPGAAQADPVGIGDDRSSARAARALEKVEDVFAGGRGDATMALRDLVLLKTELTGADRAAAERRTSRPSGLPEKICSAVVCVHYTTSGADAATTAFANRALNTVTSVHQLYVGAGYRAPKPDGSRGGDALTDIYLRDIGDQGLYGYCSTDENAPASAPRDRWAFCVLDNDYSPREFPTNTRLENLQVTAAHEYFHAVQFAYDFGEDGWFLEATATWAEDEVYDDVNDNVQYLRAESPLKQSRISMDQFGGLRHYGAWIFFRYLTERFPAEEGGMPVLVRDMIRKTDAAAGGPDLYSWRAVNNVLRTKGITSAKAFTAFAVANRRPRTTYDEAAAQRYPRPPVTSLGAIARSVTAETRLDHLASATYRVAPAKTLVARSWKLRLVLDLPNTSRGSAAAVTTYFKSGLTRVQWVRLDRTGSGAKVVPFSQGTVSRVEVTLVNASGRFRCWRDSPYSCNGIPRDDNLPQQLRARPFR